MPDSSGDFMFGHSLGQGALTAATFALLAACAPDQLAPIRADLTRRSLAPCQPDSGFSPARLRAPYQPDFGF